MSYLTGIPFWMAIGSARQVSGSTEKITASAFLTILRRMSSPLVVVAETGLVKSKFKYLTSYKGLSFYTESSQPIDLPGDAEIVKADNL